MEAGGKFGGVRAVSCVCAEKKKLEASPCLEVAVRGVRLDESRDPVRGARGERAGGERERGVVVGLVQHHEHEGDRHRERVYLMMTNEE